MIKALIFDFDGLILDTEQPDFQSWKQIYAEHGANLSLEVWLPLIGGGASTMPFHPHDYLESLTGRTLDRQEIRRRRRERLLDLVAAQPLMPGVERVIAEAQRLNLRLAVASSSSQDWVGGQLDKRDLHRHFACVSCGDQVVHAKPWPDVYQAALSGLGIKPDEAIALEDSLNGLRAAKAAGIFCIAIPNPMLRQFSFDEADLVIDSLADFDLEELVNRLNEQQKTAS